MFKRSLLALIVGAAGVLWAQSTPVSALPSAAALSTLPAVASRSDNVIQATFGHHRKAQKKHAKKCGWFHGNRCAKRKPAKVKRWHRVERKPRVKKQRWWHHSKRK